MLECSETRTRICIRHFQTCYQNVKKWFFSTCLNKPKKKACLITYFESVRNNQINSQTDLMAHTVIISIFGIGVVVVVGSVGKGLIVGCWPKLYSKEVAYLPPPPPSKLLLRPLSFTAIPWM